MTAQKLFTLPVEVHRQLRGVLLALVLAAGASDSSPSPSASPRLPSLPGAVVEVRSSVCSARGGPGGATLAVAELVVVTDDGFNLAPAGVPTASSAFAAAPAVRVNDGVVDQAYPPLLAPGAFWAASALCTPSDPQWIRITLPRVAAIVRVDVYSRGLNYCGDCDEQVLVGASLNVYLAGTDTAPAWTAVVPAAALAFSFFPGFAAGDPRAFAASSNATTTAAVAPPPYPSSTATATASVSATATATSTPPASPTAAPTPSASSTAAPTQSTSPTAASSPSASPPRTPPVTPSGTPSPCPPGWTQPSGSRQCYQYFGGYRTQGDASSLCASVAAALGFGGGYLASVRSQGEADFVLGARCNVPYDGSTSAWIGLYDPTQTAYSSRSCCWSWTSGADHTWIRSPAGQTWWNSGEPNNYGGNEHCS